MQIICIYEVNFIQCIGMRLTKHRQEIFDLLHDSEHALSAAAIHKALPQINLVTIYRTLDYLTTENLITKINLGEQEAFFEVQHEPHHHAICRECNKVIHFVVDNPDLIKEFDLPDFNIESIEITLHGTCKNLKQDKRTKRQKDK
jgi:Fur family transcriptional regulator, ferric uptake regulator